MLMRHASHPHEQQGRGPRGGGGNITAAAAISANLSHQGKQLLSSIDRSNDRSIDGAHHIKVQCFFHLYIQDQ